MEKTLIAYLLTVYFIEDTRVGKYFLRCGGNKRTRKGLRRIFQSKRNNFDKRLRQAERQFKAALRNKVKILNTENPNEFWKEINRLGPHREQQRIDSVFLKNGNGSHDSNDFLEQWRNTYSQLFSSDILEVDKTPLANLEQLNAEMEAEFLNLDTSENDRPSANMELN